MDTEHDSRAEMRRLKEYWEKHLKDPKQAAVAEGQLQRLNEDEKLAGYEESKTDKPVLHINFGVAGVLMVCTFTGVYHIMYVLTAFVVSLF